MFLAVAAGAAGGAKCIDMDRPVVSVSPEVSLFGDAGMTTNGLDTFIVKWARCALKVQSNLLSTTGQQSHLGNRKRDHSGLLTHGYYYSLCFHCLRSFCYSV